MPDTTLSQALREAYATAPADEVIHHTLEIWHPAFTEPIRVVRDHADLGATLEAGAPRNPGASVNFTAFAFEVSPPELSPDASPSLTIELDNVGRELLTQVELASSSAVPIEVIYRQYLASELGAPQNNPPLALQVLSISATPLRVTVRCGFGDLGNRKFPARTYSAADFPGLAA